MSDKSIVQLLPSNHRYPDVETFFNATKLAITDDKPILLDYWTDSIDKNVALGVKTSNGEKLLVKSKDEYTSTILNLYKSGKDLIIVAENSIYLVDSSIPRKHQKLQLEQKDVQLMGCPYSETGITPDTVTSS